MIAVGQVAINLTPLPVKDWATSTFGNNDKNVLLTGVFVVVFLYAIVVGVVAMRRLSAGFVGLAIFAVIGMAAALTRPHAAAGWALPTLVRRAGRGVRAVPAGDRRAAGGFGWRSGGAGNLVGFRGAAADRVRRAGE